LVHLLSGDVEHYPKAVYKAEVVQAFKGVEKGTTIYFGPFMGYGLGDDLWCSCITFRKGIDPSKRDQFRPELRTNFILSTFSCHQGYSALRIEYDCVFDGKETRNDVRWNQSEYLPGGLTKECEDLSSSTRGSFSEDTKWVRKTVLVEYLRKLSKSRLTDYRRSQFKWTVCGYTSSTHAYLTPTFM